MQVFLVVCYRSDASFPFRVKKKRWWDREKKKKKKLERELFPPLLRCTTAIQAVGVYIYVYSCCMKNTLRQRGKIKIESNMQDENRDVLGLHIVAIL